MTPQKWDRRRQRAATGRSEGIAPEGRSRRVKDQGRGNDTDWARETRERHRRESAWEPWGRDADYDEEGTSIEESLQEKVSEAASTLASRQSGNAADVDVMEARAALNIARRRLEDFRNRRGT